MILLASLALMALAPAGAASAADMPAKAPVDKAPAAAGYNWTGFYIGGNVGYGVARDPSQSVLVSGGAPIPFLDTFNLGPRGVLGGGQLGFNWQAAPNWILGIETDIQAGAQTDSTTCVTLCNAVDFTRVSQKLPWFGTLRGRLGWTNGASLYYLTGGLAYGEARADYTVSSAPGPDSHSFSHTRTGWTLGGGVETPLTGRWTAKVEYLYIDLGSVTDAFIYAPQPTISYTESSELRNHVVRLGLNYRFGDPVSAPAGGSFNAPPATAAFNWTGFYIGGNVGYGVARDPSQSILASSGVPAFFETFNLGPRGVLGGGQLGFNWQAAPNWVLGIETDIQAGAQTDSTTCVTLCNAVDFTRVSQKLPWFGTLRGRLGWTNGASLYYLTGGLAYGEARADYAVDAGFGPDSHSFSHTRTGWTLGGGVETPLAGRWTAKVEYLYVDLGSVTDAFIYAPQSAIGYAESSELRNHVVRLGLNYRFGSL